MRTRTAFVLKLGTSAGLLQMYPLEYLWLSGCAPQLGSQVHQKARIAVAWPYCSRSEIVALPSPVISLLPVSGISKRSNPISQVSGQ